jgi:hypothetical protein
MPPIAWCSSASAADDQALVNDQSSATKNEIHIACNHAVLDQHAPLNRAGPICKQGVLMTDQAHVL